MNRALEICADFGGEWDKDALQDDGSQRKGAAGNWRNKLYMEHRCNYSMYYFEHCRNIYTNGY